RDAARERVGRAAAGKSQHQPYRAVRVILRPRSNARREQEGAEQQAWPTMQGSTNTHHSSPFTHHRFLSTLRTCSAASARVPIHTSRDFFAISITHSNAHMPVGRPNTCACTPGSIFDAPFSRLRAYSRKHLKFSTYTPGGWPCFM